MADDQAVLFERAEGLGIITLNRPAAFNALDLGMADGLLAALIECDEDPAVRAVLISGSGAAFCAGGDIRQMLAHVGPAGHPSAFLKLLTSRLHAGIATMARMAKPVVTAVNGPAAGAGMSIAMAGDLTLAADTAKFTVAYTGVGLVPDGSSSYFLPRLVGLKRAYELIALNRPLTAAEALDAGLVNQVLPAADFGPAARDYAMKLAAGPTVALGAAKRLLADSLNATLETQMERERQAIGDCGRTEDFRNAAEAFVAKRKPVFQGR